MGGLRQQPAVDQPHALLRNTNNQLRSLCLVDDKGQDQPDDVPVGGLRQQPAVPQPQARLRNSNSQLRSLHLLMTRGGTSLMMSPWVGFASSPRSLSLRHTYAKAIVRSEVSSSWWQGAGPAWWCLCGWASPAARGPSAWGSPTQKQKFSPPNISKTSRLPVVLHLLCRPAFRLRCTK